MGRATIASVLIVDDHEDGNELRAFLRTKRIETKVRHPEDVEMDDIVNADLVLVDYQLEYWPERDMVDVPLSRQPRDGLALASVLRRHVHDREKGSPTAFAILTGKIDQLAAPLPPENRERALARISNLEWVFQKSKPGEAYVVGEQIAELATGVRRLPRQWQQGANGDGMLQLARDVLDVDRAKLHNSQIIEDVAACIPPIHELSQWSHGLAIVRWLLHRILPYPCFLWDSYHLAARLRVDHSWLKQSLQDGKGLAKFFAPCCYTGLLGGFAGPRWWRAGVEALLWDATKRESFNGQRVWDVLSKASRAKIKRSSPPDHPVVCVNADYRPLERFASIETSVRIMPDDWPSYADQASTTIELATSEPRLSALVIAEDRERLHGERK